MTSSREDRPGDVRLVAYVVPKTGQAPTDRELRRHLKAHLPDYMVPQHFVAIDRLPMTPNGKIDRNTLPKPQTEVTGTPLPAAEPPRAYPDKRTAYLAGIWAQLLETEVAAADNFFDLGGHSMLAVQMANLVRRDTGVRLQLMTLATQSLAQVASGLPAEPMAAQAGLGARIVGNLKGILRGDRAVRQP